MGSVLSVHPGSMSSTLSLLGTVILLDRYVFYLYNTKVWLLSDLFYLTFQQVLELYNGCAVPFHYKVDLAVLSQLQKDNFNHQILRCLNPEGEVLPGQTVMLEWIFSPIEAKMYQVSENSGIRFQFFVFLLTYP